MQAMLWLLEWQVHKILPSLHMQMYFKNIVSKSLQTVWYYLGNSMYVLYISCKTYDQSWGPNHNQPYKI